MIEQVSTTVVISGDAMMAGSMCSFFANNGSVQPMILAMMTINDSDSAITIAIFKSLYIIKIRIPLAIARPIPTSYAMRNSLKITRKMSLNLISSRASPRMIRVELCEPQLPPVSISIGINDTRSGTAANAFS